MRKRDYILLGAALVLALAGVAFFFRGQALETAAWGLSFRQEGAPPVGNADGAHLRTLDAAYLGDTTQKRLYLTFDAGYENGCTPQILDVLKAHQVPAAFFLVGNYLEKNGDLVRRMVQEGHTVGNHTMHHYDMSKLQDKAAFSRELGYVGVNDDGRWNLTAKGYLISNTILSELLIAQDDSQPLSRFY